MPDTPLGILWPKSRIVEEIDAILQENQYRLPDIRKIRVYID